MDKERFSLLLLEPSEIYFEDFAVKILKPVTQQLDESQRQGRLKMCSKSIVYDPKDISQPLIKISFKDCEEIYRWSGNLQTKEINVLAISCKQHTEMLANNVIAPYKFKTVKVLFMFHFHYANVDDYLPQLCQLHRASSLHIAEQNSMIATIIYSRHNRNKFDLLWLEDVYEKVIVDFQVDEITPLVVNPGRLLLSSKAIYFQPYNNIHPYPVKKIKLKSIKSFINRRFLLRQVGLEIKWLENETLNLLYVSFRRENERESFCKATSEQEEYVVKEPEPESMILKWQNGVISNYEYLLYLNSLADRTFQDLTQYPVFPWIIADYTSQEIDLNDSKCYRDLTKPIGALNPERLNRLKERCEEMGDPKFLYGSHYSAPGLVLFYLVRKYPKYMLCLQNGRFDHPDRMFNKVADAFHNCLNNMSDFKELIPEFYDTTTKGDFLMNNLKINFGHRADGTPVNHVFLPPWSNNCPETFVAKLRDALESDYVSKNLNHWIDLIFGYKQRGKTALEFDNLFYYLCYEGSVDLDNVSDMAKRHALEVQISEFGQIPRQLFDRPHVPRQLTKIPRLLSTGSYSDTGGGIECQSEIQDDQVETHVISSLELDFKFFSHKDMITSIVVDKDKIISTGRDGVLKCYDMETKKQLRSVSIGSMPISSCIQIPDTNIIILGSWDNSIISYDLDYGKSSNVIPAHDDAVSCLAYLEELGLLVSGSWDCSVKVWKGFDKKGISSFRMSDSMRAYLSLDERVLCLDIYKSDDLIKILIGTAAGEVILWQIDAAIAASSDEDINQTVIHNSNSTITGIAFNPDGTKIVSCDEAGNLCIFYTSTGMIIFKRELYKIFTCLYWTCNDFQVLVGDNNGKLYIWDMFIGKIMIEMKAHDGTISKITKTKDNKKVITAGIDNDGLCIKVWSTL